MGDISRRLSRHEFACRCGCGFRTVDHDNPAILEDCADYFQTKYMASRCFIHVNSGCRCREYNEVVQKKDAEQKGKIYEPYSSKSRHMWGDAVDFWLEIITHTGMSKRIDGLEVYDYLNKLFPTSKGIGKYKLFTHLDQGPYRRW